MRKATSITYDPDLPIWEPTVKDKDREFSDEVIEIIIDAYLKGEINGYSKAQSARQRADSMLFQANLEKAMNVSIAAIGAIEKQFKCRISNAFLKADNRFRFVSAIILPMDLYYSDNIKPLTEMLIEFELDNRTELFNIEFTSMPNKKTLDFQKLFLNGFTLKYAPKQRRKKA